MRANRQLARSDGTPAASHARSAQAACRRGRSAAAQAALRPTLRNWTELAWTGLNWPGLDWPGLDWTGLAWTGRYITSAETVAAVDMLQLALADPPLWDEAYAQLCMQVRGGRSYAHPS